MTQYDLEVRYAAWRECGADPSRAGTVGEWVLMLGPDRLLLNPVAERWFYFDAAHGEWLDCDIVAGEAIFVSIGGVLGAKRALSEDELSLPLAERIERVASRVVGALDGELIGPMELREAAAIASSRPGASLHVWSTRSPQWISA